VHYLLFNTANTDRPELANPALWQAARWLIDYQGIAHGLLKDQFQVHQAFWRRDFQARSMTRPIGSMSPERGPSCKPPALIKG